MKKCPNECKGTTKIWNNQINASKKCKGHHFLSDFYKESHLIVDSAEKLRGHLYVNCHFRGKTGICPYCGFRSRHVHSRYYRTLHDVPILDTEVVLRIRARKFFCINKHCSHKTFAEQSGIEVFRYQRRTRRCEVKVLQIGGVNSSPIAQRILNAWQIPISNWTILRKLHQVKVPDVPDVKQIGIDDWAYRKGVSYGSVIVNLETHSYLGLLGDRGCDSFYQWLQTHPNVSIVSRDRSTEYSAAIASTNRNIIEVADRFHLVKNMSERLGKIINEHYVEYKRLVRPVLTPSVKAKLTRLPVSGTIDSRQHTFDEVKRLQAAGINGAEISRRVGISRMTVYKYERWTKLPPRAHNARARYHEYDERVIYAYQVEGRNLNQILTELQTDGVKISRTPFYEHYKYLRNNTVRQPIKIETEEEPLWPPNLISLVTEKAIRAMTLNEKEQKLMDYMHRMKWFRHVYQAAKLFYDIIRTADVKALDCWLDTYINSPLRHIKTFVGGLVRDIKAVKNALLFKISNGIVEGYVNKLKAIKRSMYGRAGVELLSVKMYLAANNIFN
ncbi:MAG: ISL3 family transposase [Paludibacteraceae bacterium]|nr:ISL3 family transposase [Paludibacteraceae bacterium]